MILRAFAILTLCSSLLAVNTKADEVSGTVRSIDTKAGTIVLATTADGKARDMTIKVDAKTQVENRKGKVRKKFTLEQLQSGGSIQATCKEGLATKIVLGKGAIKKKDKA